MNIDRALRAVAYALLGLTALALVTRVRFAVGFRSTPPAFLHLIIVVLAARAGGFIRAVVVSASRSPISTTRSCLRSDGTGSGPWADRIPDHGARNDAPREPMTRAAQLLEERSRLLLDLTHDAVLVRDMDGRITYWNRGAEDLFGWTADEALGRVAHELLQTVWPEPFADIAARLLRTGRWRGELVHTRRDGTHITVATRWALQRDASGNPVAHLVTANDIAGEGITEAKRAQADLEFFKHVIDHTHDPIFWQSPADGFRFVYVNEAACRHFGRPAEALLRMSVPDIDPNYPLEEMQKHWQELKRRQAITIETVHRRASGEIVPVEVTTNYIAFEGEEYVVGTIRDISERKRAEEGLRASEERFRLLVDHAADAFALRDERGILVDVNRHACESLGYDREELIGMSASEIAPYVDLDAIWKRFDAGEQIVTFESRNRRKDGTLFPVEVRARRFMSPEGRPLSLTLARDISERKRAEEALHESEQRYRALIDVSPQFVWVARADGYNIYFNQRWYDYSGLTREESEGFGWAQAVHPEYRDRAMDLWRQSVATGNEVIMETPLRRADGHYRWHLARGLPIRDADGRIVRWIGIGIDIHDRREAEDALRKSEQRYRNMFEKVGVAIVEEDFSKVMTRLADLKARGVQDFRRYLAEHPELARETFASVKVTDANEAAVALFGAASKQEFFDALPRLATREVRAAWVAQLIAVAEGRRSIEEVVLTTIGGESVHALVTIVLPPESSGFESVLVTVVDLSERKRAEEALNQAQAALAHMTRITTLGELTASIAHEVNQPLAAIVNNASACLSLLSHGRADVEEVRTALADINSDAERASAVIERVRAMAKRSAPDRIPVRLADLVHEVVALMRAESATRRVAIRTDVPADLPFVLGDRVQLQQVLLNLVVNAMDAMSGADDPERSLEIRGRVDRLEGSPAVTISVEDHGVGLQPEELDRLFEAFYTTKPHGMGLGLAISRSIIEAHSGRLWGESQRGRGAVFSFRLPAAQTSRTA